MRFGLRTLLVVLALAPLVAAAFLGVFSETSFEEMETRFLILTTIVVWAIAVMIVGAWWWGRRGRAISARGDGDSREEKPALGGARRGFRSEVFGAGHFAAEVGEIEGALIGFWNQGNRSIGVEQETGR